MPQGLVLGPLLYLHSLPWRAHLAISLNTVYTLMISKPLSLAQTVSLNSRLDIQLPIQHGKYGFGLNLSRAKPPDLSPSPKLLLTQSSPTQLLASLSFQLLRPETRVIFDSLFLTPISNLSASLVGSASKYFQNPNSLLLS